MAGITDLVDPLGGGGAGALVGSGGTVSDEERLRHEAYLDFLSRLNSGEIQLGLKAPPEEPSGVEAFLGKLGSLAQRSLPVLSAPQALVDHLADFVDSQDKLRWLLSPREGE